MTMILTIYHQDLAYRVACPEGAGIHRATPDLEECLALEFTGRKNYLLTPFAIMAA
jgi:hypothetical protein